MHSLYRRSNNNNNQRRQQQPDPPDNNNNNNNDDRGGLGIITTGVGGGSSATENNTSGAAIENYGSLGTSTASTTTNTTITGTTATMTNRQQQQQQQRRSTIVDLDDTVCDDSTVGGLSSVMSPTTTGRSGDSITIDAPVVVAASSSFPVTQQQPTIHEEQHQEEQPPQAAVSWGVTGTVAPPATQQQTQPPQRSPAAHAAMMARYATMNNHYNSAGNGGGADSDDDGTTNSVSTFGTNGRNAAAGVGGFGSHYDPAILYNILEEALSPTTNAGGGGNNATSKSNNIDGSLSSSTTRTGKQQGKNTSGHASDGSVNYSEGRNNHGNNNNNQEKDRAEQTWERIRRWLWMHHNNDEYRTTAAYVCGRANTTPLHLVCDLHNPPIDIIHALIDAAPETVRWKDIHGWLPLHHACAHNASPDVIKILTDCYPEGKLEQDNLSRTPLHFATRNAVDSNYVAGTATGATNTSSSSPWSSTSSMGSNAADGNDGTGSGRKYNKNNNNNNTMKMVMIAEMLSDNGAAKLTDVGGMLPMHYGCAYGANVAVLDVLAAVYPDSITSKENNGRTPMHLAMVNAYRPNSPNVIHFLLNYNDISRSMIDARDYAGFLPLHSLAFGLKGNKTDSYDPDRVRECLLLYTDAKPDSSSADFLTAIQDLPDWLRDTAVVSKHVRTILNNKIVCRFPTSILMLDGFFLLIMIGCFGLTTAHHIDLRFGNLNDNNSSEDDDQSLFSRLHFNPNTLLKIIYVSASYFLLREVVQIASLISLGNLSSWYKDTTNWLDITVIVMVFYFAILMTIDAGHDTGEYPALMDSRSAFRTGVAFTQGILWMDIIVFWKSIYVDFAVFVRGVFYVFYRLIVFFFAVGAILVAFAQMFYYIYLRTDQCPVTTTTYDETTATNNNIDFSYNVPEFPHCSFWYSLLKVYTMMMGEIGEETRYSGNLTAQILYVLYAFLVVILLSNVLIAIVTDSYEVIQNDRAAIVFWSNRLDFVAEMDAIGYALKNRLPRWLGFTPSGKNNTILMNRSSSRSLLMKRGASNFSNNNNNGNGDNGPSGGFSGPPGAGGTGGADATDKDLSASSSSGRKQQRNRRSSSRQPQHQSMKSSPGDVADANNRLPVKDDIDDNDDDYDYEDDDEVPSVSDDIPLHETHGRSGQQQQKGVIGRNDDMNVDDNDYFREGWHCLMQYFDSDLFQELEFVELIMYTILRFICCFIVPIWLIIGFFTAGLLWPPQVREYLFAQKDTISISRSEIERNKLEQLRSIYNDIKQIKNEMHDEMYKDRDDMIRMRIEIETIQSEVYADLVQIKELMSSLIVPMMVNDEPTPTMSGGISSSMMQMPMPPMMQRGSSSPAGGGGGGGGSVGGVLAMI